MRNTKRIPVWRKDQKLELMESAKMRLEHCPTCNSHAPHLHPAMQFEGEVEICCDDFHLRDTPQNTDVYQQRVIDKRAALVTRGLDGPQEDAK